MACGQDPILQRAEEEAKADEGPANDLRPEPHQVGEPSLQGSATEASPAAGPSSPPPGVAPDPAGPSVTISGTVSYGDYQKGLLRVDIFDGDQTDFSAHPSVLAMEQMGAPGTFSVSVPRSAGKVWISAFNDANQNNRPDPDDPTGFFSGNPLMVAETDIDGIEITLQRRPPPPEP